MSRLPKGTKAARSFLETVAVEGAIAAVIASPYFSWLGWKPFRWLLEKIFEIALIRPTADQATAYALAAFYVVDRTAFDREFIALEMLDKQNVSPEKLEEALQNAEKAMYNFIRRGPIE